MTQVARHTVLSVLFLAVSSPVAFAQNLLQQQQVPGFSVAATSSPYQKSATWDYRFDPQYQSTIKPYLRWYMRYDPSKPGNRVLPRDFGFGLKHGYAFPNPAAMQSGHSNFFSTCSSCGVYGWDSGSGYISDPNSRPSLYWNHLKYLSDLYWDTPIERQTGELRNDQPRDSYRDLYDPLPSNDEEDDAPLPPEPPADDIFGSAAKEKVIAIRQIWVAKNEASESYSVLYHKPQESLAHRFAQAEAGLAVGAKIVALRWQEAPPWADQVQIVDGRLTSLR